jgi:hypothetical protein
MKGPSIEISLFIKLFHIITFRTIRKLNKILTGVSYQYMDSVIIEEELCRINSQVTIIFTE